MRSFRSALIQCHILLRDEEAGHRHMGQTTPCEDKGDRQTDTEGTQPWEAEAEVIELCCHDAWAPGTGCARTPTPGILQESTPLPTPTPADSRLLPQELPSLWHFDTAGLGNQHKT